MTKPHNRIRATLEVRNVRDGVFDIPVRWHLEFDLHLDDRTHIEVSFFDLRVGRSVVATLDIGGRGLYATAAASLRALTRCDEGNDIPGVGSDWNSAELVIGYVTPPIYWSMPSLQVNAYVADGRLTFARVGYEESPHIVTSDFVPGTNPIELVLCGVEQHVEELRIERELLHRQIYGSQE